MDIVELIQYGVAGLALYMMYDLLRSQIKAYENQSALDRSHDATERKAERDHDGSERDKTRETMLKMRNEDHKAHMDALASVLVKFDEMAGKNREHVADKLVTLKNDMGQVYEIQLKKMDELHKTQMLIDEKIKPMADMLDHVKAGVDGFPAAMRKEINETIPPFITAIEKKIDEFMINQGKKEVQNGNV